MPRTIGRHAAAGSRSAPGPGVQGTLGGPAPMIGSRPGTRSIQLGDEVYLWILVAIEVTAITWARSIFSRYHGG